MSDLYLILRHRLDQVKDWVEIGTETMRTPRDAKGLSYEAMGRLLNVSAKTYERHEKAGRLPRQLVMKFATIVDLEIDEPTRVKLTLPDDPGLAVEVHALRVQLERLIDRLDHQSASRGSAGTEPMPAEGP